MIAVKMFEGIFYFSLSDKNGKKTKFLRFIILNNHSWEECFQFIFYYMKNIILTHDNLKVFSLPCEKSFEKSLKNLHMHWHRELESDIMN